MSQSLVRLSSVAETADDIARAWLEYGKDYAKYPSLWDGSLAFASGPLMPEGGTLRDYSGRTAGAVLNSSAAMPTYEASSYRGNTFQAMRTAKAVLGQRAQTTTATSCAQITMAIWVYRISHSANGAGIFHKQLADPVNQYGDADLLASSTDGRVFFSINRNSAYAFANSVLTNGEWIHLCGTYDLAKIRLYKNGVQVHEQAQTTAMENNATTFCIGNYFNWTNPLLSLTFDGLTAGAMALNRVITPSEIAILAQHPLAAYETVRPRYISIPWTAPTPTKRALVRKSKSVDVGTDESFTIIRAWKEYGKEYAKYPNLWDGSLAFASGPLEPEGGTLRDYSGRTAGAAWSVGAGDTPKYSQGSVRGQPFWAGQYDGSNDYADAGYIANDFGTQPFSVVSWVRSTATSTTDQVIVTSDDVADSPRVFWGIKLRTTTDATNASKPTFALYNAGTSLVAYAETAIAGDGRWHSVIGQRNSSTAELWLDGVKYSVADTEINVSNANIPLWIGATKSGVLSQNHLMGGISGVSIYRRVLTPSEIAILAQHPLAAYETVRPKYWMFPTGGTHLWPWQIRRSRRVRGSR